RIRKERDCLQIFRQRVSEAGLLETDALDELDKAAHADVEAAVEAARAAPRPTAEDVLTDVYVTY
ncbi:MAG: thiamine pyrophosphate-dependent enzyme, partial [Pseudomonadota bacterium]|nr:thiamine pyrophosphate-dependent enzyme [Pseudomonadota bacterium]